MDLPPVAHLASHEDAELIALKFAVGLAKIGALLRTIETTIGEVAIFDPDAKVKEATFRDGILFGRALCEYLVDQGTRAGLGPEPLANSWPEMIQAALAFEVNRKKKESA